MKKVTFIVILLIIPVLIFAQKKKAASNKTIEIIIDSIGEVTSGLPLKFTKNDTVNIKDISFNSKTTNLIRDSLLSKVQKALDHIQDDSLYLHSLYHFLWASDSGRIIKELNDFKYFLNNNYTIPNGATYEYIPNLYDLKEKVFDRTTAKSPFSYTVKKDDDKLEIDAIYTDPFAHWFTSWYNNLVKNSNLYNQEMNYEYKKGWRELEEWYQKTKSFISKIDSTNKTFYDCTQDNGNLEKNVNELLKKIDIDNNYIVELLKNNKIFKKWLWVNEGFIQINPLSGTSIARQYPPTEHISFPDTTIKTDLNNLETFKNIQTNKRIANSITIPYSDKGDAHYLIQYNAADNYSIMNKMEFKSSNAATRLGYKDNYTVCINNL